jgi:hypothetical protein
VLRIVLLAREESGPNDAAFDVASLVEMTLALLHSAWGEATSHAVGSRAGRRHPRLSACLAGSDPRVSDASEAGRQAVKRGKWHNRDVVSEKTYRIADMSLNC